MQPPHEVGVDRFALFALASCSLAHGRCSWQAYFEAMGIPGWVSAVFYYVSLMVFTQLFIGSILSSTI